MKGLVLVADLFEDVEFIAPIDVLKRYHEDITIASVLNRVNIISKTGIQMTADTLIENVNLDKFDYLIIPGGPGAYQILVNLEIVKNTIEYFVKKNKLVCAICAAPMLIGRLGYLKNKNFTVYPGFEKNIIGGTYLKNEGVVEDGNFITAKSMYFSIQFALKIIEHFYGTYERMKHESSLRADN